MRKLYPRIDQVPAAFDAAGEVNIETLIGARPDVVLMAYGGTLPKWIETVDAYRIPVVMMPNTSLEGPEDDGAHDGRGARANANREVAAGVHSLLRRQHPPGHRGHEQDCRDSERPKVLHTATAGILTIDGRQTVIDDWITVAGGVNAADVVGNARPVTMEQIAAWNPDVIIVGTAPNQQNRQAILDDPRWRQIKAVQDGKVFVNPTGVYLWDRHSAEAALAGAVGREAAASGAVRRSRRHARRRRRFYASFFHHALTDAELASIMNATAP